MCGRTFFDKIKLIIGQNTITLQQMYQSISDKLLHQPVGYTGQTQ